ncbi:hypothetical protein KBD59_03245 [Candidatus Gracilibacteria bacterium]|nr:hypothetical protein [Candidatus Gracilibacteria bacterium]
MQPRRPIEFEGTDVESDTIVRDLFALQNPGGAKIIYKGILGVEVKEVKELGPEQIAINLDYVDPSTGKVANTTITVPRMFFYDGVYVVRERILDTQKAINIDALVSLLCEDEGGEAALTVNMLQQAASFLVKGIFREFRNKDDIPTPLETKLFIDYFITELRERTKLSDASEVPEAIHTFAEARYWIEAAQDNKGVRLRTLVDECAKKLVMDTATGEDSPTVAQELSERIDAGAESLDQALSAIPPTVRPRVKELLDGWLYSQTMSADQTAREYSDPEGIIEAVLDEYAALCFEHGVNEGRVRQIRRRSPDNENEEKEMAMAQVIAKHLHAKYGELLEHHRQFYEERGIIWPDSTNIAEALIENFVTENS